jgi:hypothetical protein
LNPASLHVDAAVSRTLLMPASVVKHSQSLCLGRGSDTSGLEPIIYVENVDISAATLRLNGHMHRSSTCNLPSGRNAFFKLLYWLEAACRQTFAAISDQCSLSVAIPPLRVLRGPGAAAAGRPEDVSKFIIARVAEA